MLAMLVSYAAGLLGPWVSTAAIIAVATFVVFLALHAWVSRCSLCVPKHAGPDDPDSRALRVGRRAAASMKNGFVGLMDWVSRVLGRVSITAALIAIAGFAAVTLTSPASAGAVAPLLDQAQAALRQTAPAAYGQIDNLGAPKVTNKDGATVFTFHTAAKKGTPAGDYTVSVHPDGRVEVQGRK